MKNQKVSTTLGSIILVIIAATVVGYVLLCFKNYPVKNDIVQTIALPQSKHVSNDAVSKKQESNENGVKEDIFVVDNWKMVTHKNFWNNPDLFSHTNYSFPQIVFYYPDSWNFQCCNDGHDASVHFIVPSQDYNTAKPHIAISNYISSGCPDKNKNCSIDEVVNLTLDEKYSQMISTIAPESKHSSIYLPNLDTEAYVYSALDNERGSSKVYLIKLIDGIIEVRFVHDEQMPKEFIEEFIKRLAKE